ncbi:MAG: porin family protein [Cryomorphaceae bacterium]|nr:PorT family protein [Flavobacteriales bacterium]
MASEKLDIHFNGKVAVWICILASSLFFNTRTFAQNAQAYGLKGGLALTTLTDGSMENIKPGLQVGVYTKLGGQFAFFFKAEFLVTQKGAWNWNMNNPKNFSLYYAELPLMYGIEVVDNLSLNIGIQTSVLLGGSLRSAENGGDTDTKPIGSDIARFDFSTLFGAEYELDDKYLVGARFNYGFVPLQNYQGDLTENGQLLKNMALEFYLGMRLE